MNKSRTNGYHSINSIAFVLQSFPMIEESLKSYSVTEHAKAFGIEYDNLFEWMAGYGSLFSMKVGLFLKLGSDLEEFFREYFLEKSGIPKTELERHLKSMTPISEKNGKYSKGNIFQRTFSNSPSDQTLRDLYLQSFGLDIETHKEYSIIKEYFIHRHLFVHQNGVPDNRYLLSIGNVLTGTIQQKILRETNIAIESNKDSGKSSPFYYPIDYRFWPSIDAARDLISKLPD